MSRMLPKIDLAGTSFTIDGRLRELRQEGAPWNIIQFNQMEEGPDGETMRFLFDKETKAYFDFTDTTTKLPSSVILLEVTHEAALDPIGYAHRRSHECSEADILALYPAIPLQDSKEIPLAESAIPGMIKARSKVHKKLLEGGSIKAGKKTGKTKRWDGRPF